MLLEGRRTGRSGPSRSSPSRTGITPVPNPPVTPSGSAPRGSFGACRVGIPVPQRPSSQNASQTAHCLQVVKSATTNRDLRISARILLGTLPRNCPPPSAALVSDHAPLPNSFPCSSSAGQTRHGHPPGSLASLRAGYPVSASSALNHAASKSSSQVLSTNCLHPTFTILTCRKLGD